MEGVGGNEVGEAKGGKRGRCLFMVLGYIVIKYGVLQIFFLKNILEFFPSGLYFWPFSPPKSISNV